MTDLAPWLTSALIASVHIWTGAPEIALAIDLSEMPHVTAERLRAVEAAMKQECQS